MKVLMFFLLLALPCRAEEMPALYSVTGVAAWDVLNIRERPEAGAPILGTLAPDATGVELLAVEGDWALVNAGERAGHVALRYLKREPGPDWNALKQPLTCLGTEPFWSLRIDPAQGTARLSTPEAEGEPLPIRQAWPGQPRARAAALSLPVGVVVLSPAACSDGMSDRSYGIAADLFLDSPAPDRLTGCCTIQPP